MGLATKSVAPASSAAMTESELPEPVIIRIGNVAESGSSRNRRMTSMPDMPGMPRIAHDDIDWRSGDQIEPLLAALCLDRVETGTTQRQRDDPARARVVVDDEGRG